MSKTKGLIGVAGVVIVAVAAWVLLWPKKQQEVKWNTTKVETGSISSSVTATGTVEPITQVEVGTQVSGIVNRIYVDYNSVVTKGQLLAELDKTVLESELASQTSTLANSKNEYEYQLKNYTRSKQLYEKKVISDTDYETAEYQYLKAKASYEKSQSDMVKARTNLGYAIITSPIDGVVLSRAVDEGQTVAASFNTPTLFTIANDLRKMQVVADVDEADIGQVQTGQRVSFTVDAYPNDVFEGDVMQVRLEATTTSNVVTYEVIVNAPNPDLKLKPGLTANITVYTLERKDVLRLPAKAFHFTPVLEATDGQTPVPGELPATADSTGIVWVREGDRISYKVVETGESNSVYTEIRGGLSAGDEVVTGESLVVDAGADTSAEQSPFMPKRPSSDKKKTN